jgi:hypothetical protein
LFPAKESLVSDIPAGDGKTANLFYSVDGGWYFIRWLALRNEMLFNQHAMAQCWMLHVIKAEVQESHENVNVLNLGWRKPN